MSADPMRVTDLLALSHVPRWVIVPCFKIQTVADHTFRMIVIARELVHRLKLASCESLNVGALITAILVHDVSESRTGDIPTPAKVPVNWNPDQGIYCPWVNSEDPYWNLPEELKSVMALADLIEAFTWIETWGRGNHAVKASIGVRQKIVELTPPGWVEVVNRLIDDISFDEGR